MATNNNNKRSENKTSSGQQPSRLQRRAPASISINPVKEWNVAIPLLSPLTSPVDRSIEMKLRDQDLQQQHKKKNNNSNQGMEGEKPPVFKKWQHPAAPFGYEPNTQSDLVLSFESNINISSILIKMI
ncbi:hypothetical protein QQ045_000007 [Rhodiola kirilowii]